MSSPCSDIVKVGTSWSMGHPTLARTYQPVAYATARRGTSTATGTGQEPTTARPAAGAGAWRESGGVRGGAFRPPDEPFPTDYRSIGTPTRLPHSVHEPS